MPTCQYCNTPLPAHAQFCPRCGAYVSVQNASGEQLPASQNPVQTTPTKGSYMYPPVANPVSNQSQQQPRRKRRSVGGCALGCLTALVVFLLIVGAGWLFIGRPYVHAIAERQLNSALTSAVNRVPESPLIKLIPSGTTISINEDIINNMISQGSSSSSPVQSPSTKITSQNVTLSFSLYGFPCSISMVPAVSNGHLVAQNVQVNGIIGLVMSPDEMTGILNQHFQDAQNRLGRSLSGAKLSDQKLDLTLS